jgi:sulfide:quinone oxidoreductase
MRVLVVGGGTGGTIFANHLARRISSELKSGKASITMLSASDKHAYLPALLYVAFGKMMPEEVYHEQASLLDPAINFIVDPVEKFNLKDNNVVTKGGKTHQYDLIVIATGSRSMPELVPGLAENSIDVYTEHSAIVFFDKINAFKGGRIVITVGLPHKCPMIPLEVTFLMHDFVAERGLLDKTEFYYTYPIGRLHSLENVGKWAVGEFASLGIKTETLFNMKEIDGKNAKVISEEGTEVSYDLLIAIPPHKGMEVIEKNGLGQNGWIPTNKETLHMEGDVGKNVIVLGDTTNIPISKAGSTAHFQAETAAENVAALIKIGRPVRPHDGKVYCFLEAGGNRATYASFNYVNPPQPPAANSMLHQFKLAYNQLYWASARGVL